MHGLLGRKKTQSHTIVLVHYPTRPATAWHQGQCITRRYLGVCIGPFRQYDCSADFSFLSFRSWSFHVNLTATIGALAHTSDFGVGRLRRALGRVEQTALSFPARERYRTAHH